MIGLIALLLVVAVPKPAPTTAPHPPQRPSQATAHAYAGDLFSRRARHRAAIMLRMRWEDLRLAQLERIRAAIRREIPIDELLREATAPSEFYGIEGARGRNQATFPQRSR